MIGLPELVVILVIILVLFGARKLPELGEGLGKGIKGFQKSIKGMTEEQDEQKPDPTNSINPE